MLGKCQVLICTPGKPRNRQGQACADAAGWVEAVPRPFSSFSAGHLHGHQFCTKGSFPTKPTKPIIRGKKKKLVHQAPYGIGPYHLWFPSHSHSLWTPALST